VPALLARPPQPLLPLLPRCRLSSTSPSPSSTDAAPQPAHLYQPARGPPLRDTLVAAHRRQALPGRLQPWASRSNAPGEGEGHRTGKEGQQNTVSSKWVVKLGACFQAPRVGMVRVGMVQCQPGHGRARLPETSLYPATTPTMACPTLSPALPNARRPFCTSCRRATAADTDLHSQHSQHSLHSPPCCSTLRSGGEGRAQRASQLISAPPRRLTASPPSWRPAALPWGESPRTTAQSKPQRSRAAAAPTTSWVIRIGSGGPRAPAAPTRCCFPPHHVRCHAVPCSARWMGGSRVSRICGLVAATALPHWLHTAQHVSPCPARPPQGPLTCQELR